MTGDSEPNDAPQDEAAAMSQRIATLEQQLAECQRTEELSRGTAERYRVLLESLSDPIVVYDTKGLVTYLNPAFEQIFGWWRCRWSAASTAPAPSRSSRRCSRG